MYTAPSSGFPFIHFIAFAHQIIHLKHTVIFIQHIRKLFNSDC